MKELIHQMQLEDKNLQYINHVFNKLYKNKNKERNPRNRMIIDLKQKGYSYNAINRELIKSGFYISVQRVAEVVKQGLYKK